jgi:hypothetical protein
LHCFGKVCFFADDAGAQKQAKTDLPATATAAISAAQPLREKSLLFHYGGFQTP